MTNLLRRANTIILRRAACHAGFEAAILKQISTTSSKFQQVGSKYEWAVTDMPPPSPGRGIFGRASNFDVTKREGTVEKWTWLLEILGFMNEDDRLYRDSTAMLHSCVNQTAIPEFYRALHLQPNFRGQQALLMVHIWILHRRLSFEGNQGKIMQEILFDRLWEETVVRIRHQNVSELTVNKYLEEVQQVCFNACVAYDAGLKSGSTGLQDAFISHLLDENCTSKRKVAALLADYVQEQMKNLCKIDANLIMEGTIPWAKPPSITITTPEVSQDSEVILIGQKFGNWRTALDNRGKLYYWNLTTRISSWDAPKNYNKQ
jgi:hypothetical protein